MKNNDFEFIKNKFDNDNITAPDCLDKEKISEMISDKEQVKLKIYKRKSFKTIVSLVACFAVVITAISVAKPLNKNRILSEGSNEISTFSSYHQIENEVKKIEKERYEYKANGSMFDGVIGGIEKGTDSAEGVFNIASEAENDYAQTNMQVDGVAEGDVILNNGKYIFFADNSYSSEDCEVKIYEGTDVISTIPIKSDRSYGNYINDMYIYDDKLIVNYDKQEKSEESEEFDYSILDYGYTEIYDISNINEPVLKDTFYQSGRFLSTRMIDSVLYLVTMQSLNSSTCKTEGDYAPVISDNDKRATLSVKCICYAENPNNASNMVISALDVNTGKRTSNTKAVFGAGTDLYCNKNNLYIPISTNDESENAMIQVFRVSLTEDMKISTCMVNGYCRNQFSMDEYNGYFRIATTSIAGVRTISNNLYIFDSELNKVGEVTGFAAGETIQSVRFMQDTAYVITYEQTDPLFTIDLSSPTNPKIMGELKITGFSSMLYPIDENTILGIGYETHMEYGSDITDGMKLALFDISNKADPKVMDTKVFKDVHSNAQENHKAFVINKAKGYYLIDFGSYSFNNQKEKAGAITFSIRDGKISVTNQFEMKDTSASDCRTTFIGDNIYAVDNSSHIEAFKYK